MKSFKFGGPQLPPELAPGTGHEKLLPGLSGTSGGSGLSGVSLVELEENPPDVEPDDDEALLEPDDEDELLPLLLPLPPEPELPDPGGT